MRLGGGEELAAPEHNQPFNPAFSLISGSFLNLDSHR